jgi:plastocyanin
VFRLKKVAFIGLLLLAVVLTLGCIGETPEVQKSESLQTTIPPETPAEHFPESPRPTTIPPTTLSPSSPSTTIHLTPTPSTTIPTLPPTTTSTTIPEADSEPSFEIPKKSAHYESNTPEHGAILAGVPINVVIDFNFDLIPLSKISIIKDDVEYGIGDIIIDEGRLAMRRKMDPNSPDGVYTVFYDACWPGGSCHDGKFQFAIKRAEGESYTDLTGQNNVNIDMFQISFNPPNIRVSKGATVTWTNQEDIEHFVNTDSHPAHTYFPDQNSRGLKIGDTYSVTFIEVGAYPYHCSAHASIMKGVIVVTDSSTITTSSPISTTPPNTSITTTTFNEYPGRPPL